MNWEVCIEACSSLTISEVLPEKAQKCNNKSRRNENGKRQQSWKCNGHSQVVDFSLQTKMNSKLKMKFSAQSQSKDKDYNYLSQRIKNELTALLSYKKKAVEFDEVLL